MDYLEKLQKEYAMSGLISFHLNDEGVIVADIDNDFATASISLNGGHLLSWQPKDQVKPVIWLSKQAKIAAGKSIRGGIPLCWPWFGAHSSEDTYPAHGYARTSHWAVTETAALANGETEIELSLEESEASETYWPYATPLTLRITIGKTLKLALTTRNDSADSVTITEALHTYFHISDITSVSVTGLENTEYLDKVDNFASKRQEGNIQFHSETDRVYINSAQDCTIIDPELQRRIHISKSSSNATIVWTPWTEKAEKMGDLGENDGWRTMLCVESGNAMENTITIAPGNSHTLVAHYSVEVLEK